MTSTCTCLRQRSGRFEREFSCSPLPNAASSRGPVSGDGLEALRRNSDEDLDRRAPPEKPIRDDARVCVWALELESAHSQRAVVTSWPWRNVDELRGLYYNDSVPFTLADNTRVACA